VVQLSGEHVDDSTNSSERHWYHCGYQLSVFPGGNAGMFAWIDYHEVHFTNPLC